jgi:hypothetical protein
VNQTYSLNLKFKFFRGGEFGRPEKPADPKEMMVRRSTSKRGKSTIAPAKRIKDVHHDLSVVSSFRLKKIAHLHMSMPKRLPKSEKVLPTFHG